MKTIEIWTDGSGTSEGPGGWAAVLVFTDTKGEKHEREYVGWTEEATNNRMELMACIMGLRALTEPCTVTLVTDSMYVLKGFTLYLPKWLRNNWKNGPKRQNDVKNRDLWEQLLNAAQPHTITWEHVHGHSGHVHNEKADELAGKARAFAMDKIGLGALLPEAEETLNATREEAVAV